MDKPTITAADFNTPLSILDRSSRQKIRKNIDNFGNVTNQVYQQTPSITNVKSIPSDRKKRYPVEIWLYKREVVITHHARWRHNKKVKLPTNIVHDHRCKHS